MVYCIVVYESFTIGYFRVKIVHGKILSSLRVFDENFLFLLGQTFCPIAHKLNA